MFVVWTYSYFWSHSFESTEIIANIWHWYHHETCTYKTMDNKNAKIGILWQEQNYVLSNHHTSYFLKWHYWPALENRCVLFIFGFRKLPSSIWSLWSFWTLWFDPSIIPINQHPNQPPSAIMPIQPSYSSAIMPISHEAPHSY